MSSSAGVVTLLFTDLVASTELLARVGDDAAEELRQVHFGLLRTAIDTSGGQEVKTLGDGVMAAFASSLQAMRSAVAIQRAVDDHNRRQPGQVLRVRIGLHAGEPVQAEDDFHGTAVVVAKRLCDTAEGGQILASEVVRSLVGSRGQFSFRPAGRLRLKGLPEPVPAVTVEWRPGPAATTAPKPKETRPPTPVQARGLPLVGREQEMAILEEEFERAAAAEFRCVLLVGEPGVGKTRLGAELLARHVDGVIGLAARAHPLGATSAFGVWAEALERHLRTLDAPGIEHLCAGFLDDLAQLLRSVAAVRGRAGDDDPPRSRLLEALAVVMANLSEDRPVVLVIDDLQDADPSSLEALRYVGQSCSNCRVLVVVTARAGELTGSSVAGDIVLGLEQQGVLRRMAVGPLPSDDLRGLAAAVVGQEVPNALVAWLEQRSQGNPLYALGLVGALVAEQADLSAPALRRLPESLSERVAGVLGHLDRDAVGVLELLAVLGRRTELRSLVAVSGAAPDSLAETLEQLVRSRLVLEEERGLELVYEISHPLVQDAIYDGIGAARRRRLHRQVGRALVSSDRLGEAAPHFVRSAEPDDAEAVDVLRDAVQQAEAREAYQESLTILAAMAELLPAGDPRWVDVVDALAPDARWVIEHRADLQAVAGIPALRAMDEALRDLGDPLRQARVKFRLSTFLGWGSGELEESERVGREALALFQAASDQRGEIIARHELALLAGVRGEPAVYWEGVHRVAEEARALGDALALSRVLRSVGQAGAIYGHFEEARAALTEVAEAARKRGDTYGLMVNLGFLVITLSIEGQTHEAERLLVEAKGVSSGWRETPLVFWQAVPSWVAGNCPLAIERGREALAAWPATLGRRQGALITLSALAALDAGETAEAERFVMRSRAAYGTGDFFHYSDLVQLTEAVLAYRKGRRHDGVSLLRGATEALLHKQMAATIPIMLLLPEWIDHPDLAARVADALEERFDQTRTEISRATARLAQAWAKATVADWKDAAAVAEEATELLSAFEPNVYLPSAFELLGRARMNGGDPAGAVAALERAAAVFDAGGANWRRDQVADLLRGLGAKGQRVAAAAFGPGSLTDREREVARLAVQGHSAREIGERLFIGARTVEGHLARAYAKLGVSSKVELARRAAELGLVPDDGNA